jgi:Transposase DDE domain group 1
MAGRTVAFSFARDRAAPSRRQSARRLHDGFTRARVDYPALAEIIRFRLLIIGAGYEDGNDASSLRSDPMFKMALDLSPSDRELCSQSTISRLENLPDARALLAMGCAMVDLYFQWVPKRITLDIDDTFDAVHGGQQLPLFNAHYDEYGFQPIIVFDGGGRFVTAVLRPAKRPSYKLRPKASNQQWHTDVMYVWAASFYFLLSFAYCALQAAQYARDVAAVIKTHNLIEIKTKSWHPESNGFVERFNGTVRDESNNDYGDNYCKPKR